MPETKKLRPGTSVGAYTTVITKNLMTLEANALFNMSAVDDMVIVAVVTGMDAQPVPAKEDLHDKMITVKTTTRNGNTPAIGFGFDDKGGAVFALTDWDTAHIPATDRTYNTIQKVDSYDNVEIYAELTIWPSANIKDHITININVYSTITE